MELNLFCVQLATQIFLGRESVYKSTERYMFFFVCKYCYALAVHIMWYSGIDVAIIIQLFCVIFSWIVLDGDW